MSVRRLLVFFRKKYWWNKDFLARVEHGNKLLTHNKAFVLTNIFPQSLRATELSDRGSTQPTPKRSLSGVEG